MATAVEATNLITLHPWGDWVRLGHGMFAPVPVLVTLMGVYYQALAFCHDLDSSLSSIRDIIKPGNLEAEEGIVVINEDEGESTEIGI